MKLFRVYWVNNKYPALCEKNPELGKSFWYGRQKEYLDNTYLYRQIRLIYDRPETLRGWTMGEFFRFIVEMHNPELVSDRWKIYCEETGKWARVNPKNPMNLEFEIHDQDDNVIYSSRKKKLARKAKTKPALKSQYDIFGEAK